jgi:hypothetical protein
MKRAFIHTYRKALAAHGDVKLFGEGLRRHGWTVYEGDYEAYKGADLVVQWNVRLDGLLKVARAAGAETCILETAYLEPRKDYVSVSFGTRINNRNRFYGPFDDASRWQNMFAANMQEWTHRADGYALIMGQMPGDQAVRPYVNFYDWAAATRRQLIGLGYDVKFRAHPGQTLPAKNKWVKHAKVCVHWEELELYRGLEELQSEKATLRQMSLKEALAGASHVITFNSNSGVDSVMAGLPTVAVDRGAMAWPVTGHDIGEIIRPDRAAWAHKLAWCQWTRDELQSGECWNHVCPERFK